MKSSVGMIIPNIWKNENVPNHQPVMVKPEPGWWCNNNLEKYEFVNGKDAIPYMKWNIKFMFETTNQIMINWFVSLG